jgi:hypothetical protein
VDLAELSAELEKAASHQGAAAEARQALSSARAEIHALKRKLKDLERDLKDERAKGVQNGLPWNLERWCVRNNVVATWGATQRGEIQIRLKVGRRRDGREIVQLYDFDDKKSHPLRKAIEFAKKSGRGE